MEQDVIENFKSAIDRAIEELPLNAVLSIVTGVFVGLTEELVRREGHDVSKEIRIDGGNHRDITIHEEKEK